MKTKLIFTRWLALALRKTGCKIIRTIPNYKYPQLDVYVFIEDEEFDKNYNELVKHMDELRGLNYGSENN